MRFPRTLLPLRSPVFRSVWLANLVSNFGGLIQLVGAAWMMTLISDTADMVTLVQAAAALPIMLFSLLSGAIADNFSRRTTMLVAQIFMFLVSLLLALVSYAGLATPWLLLAFCFLIGCGTALNNPSWQVSIAEMVPRTDLPDAVALNSLGFNLTRGAGPAMGGVVVVAFGAAAAFAINAVSYLPLIAILWRWKPPVRTDILPREALGAAVAAGLRYVALSPHIQSVLLRCFLFGFSAISVLALLPLVARGSLEGGALLYGTLFAAFGIGAVGGALLSGLLRERLSTEWSARLAFIGFATCALTLSIGPWVWLVVISLLIGGACWVIALSMFNISVQLSTPRWVVGRALSVYQMALFGGQAIGAWAWGVAANSLGPAAALAIAAAVLMLGAAIGFGKLALPALASADLNPSNRWEEPAIAAPMVDRNGPMVIMIEYGIRDHDKSRFLRLMAERRRIKRRDGARNWSLVRDVEIVGRWVETYCFPSWLEYRRYNQRVTQADSGLSDQIKGLHVGEAPPRISRMLHEPVSRHASDVAEIAPADM